MYLISAEGYQNGEIWVSMKDCGYGLGVTTITDLVLKEIRGICETKNPTKEQINNYKMTERKIYKKFDNSSEDELNTMSNRNVYVKNNIMTNIIKHCRGEKKRGIKVIDGFRQQLMIPDYEISVSIEHVVKSKNRDNIFC